MVNQGAQVWTPICAACAVEYLWSKKTKPLPVSLWQIDLHGGSKCGGLCSSLRWTKTAPCPGGCGARSGRGPRTAQGVTETRLPRRGYQTSPEAKQKEGECLEEAASPVLPGHLGHFVWAMPTTGGDGCGHGLSVQSRSPA